MARVYFNPYIDPEAGLDPNMNIWSNPYGTISSTPPSPPKQSGAGSIANLAGQAGGTYLGTKTGGGALVSALSGGSSSAPVAGITDSAISLTPDGGLLGYEGAASGSAASGLTPTATTDITNFAGTATPYLGAAGTAYGAYNAYEGIKNKNPMQAGLGGVGAGLGINAMGYALGPYGWAAMAAAPIVMSLANKYFDKPSTRDIARKHTKDLLGTGADNPTWQNYVQGMRKQYDAAPPDPSKPFAGKYATWQDYKKGGLEAGDLTGVYGNLKTFGPDWASYDQGKRQAITQKIIDAGLYDSKKGEVVITDEAKAKEIAKGITSPPPTKNFRKLDGRK